MLKDDEVLCDICDKPASTDPAMVLCEECFAKSTQENQHKIADAHEVEPEWPNKHDVIH